MATDENPRLSQENPKRPLVMIHGYSDNGDSFRKWAEVVGRSSAVRNLHIGNYASLTNEVTIKDIAEGFDRALRVEGGLGEDEEFDAIVHSTGMLVVRAWLTTYPRRRSRLKHLIGLAPATNGSPLAHKGRSWLGAIFKGNRQLGPDFLEAGNQILDGLELGSRFTWDLAQRDLLGDQPFYGLHADTPYVFIFCGDTGYGGLRALASEPGTDGTVRWAGCSLNSRKIVLDLTRFPGEAGRQALLPWSNVTSIPLIFVAGVNHATIMSEPPELLQKLVLAALEVESQETLQTWCEVAEKASEATRNAIENWQQFVVRLVDERGDPIPDFNVQFMGSEDGQPLSELPSFAADVHTYGRDASLRNFHVNLKDVLGKRLSQLQIVLTASSGSELVAYYGIGDSGQGAATRRAEPTKEILINLTPTLGAGDQQIQFFYPFTTTFVEIKLNREPVPLSGKNRIYQFIDWHASLTSVAVGAAEPR
jgi:pimeloyl-ACP methyl ester carboxylesterase